MPICILLEMILENKGNTLKKKKTIGDAIDLSIQIIGGGVEGHILRWGTYGNA